MTRPPPGYIELIRTNRNFRSLWLGGFISQLGDWFNTVAIFTLLLNLTGSGESVGYILIIKLLPTFFFGPLAGVVADRFSRKAIMIISDLVRGVVVLGLLLVESPDQVWMVYALATAQVIVSTFFEPAKSAAIPSIVSRAELVSANALSGASWSATLALGAALGGLVTDAFGQSAAFVIDALSFGVSAVLISTVRMPSRPTQRQVDRRSPAERPARSRISIREVTGLADLIEGARYLRSDRRVLALLTVKSGWGLGGGVLLLLTIFGREIFPIGRDGGTSIGLLYAARGIGALVGPIFARRLTDGSARMLRRAIAAAFFVSAFFYLLFAAAPNLIFAVVFVIGAHAGGSIQWVFSTTLLQLTVPDRFLGRVFAIELALVTLTMSISTYLTGWGIDRGIGPRFMAGVLGLVFLLPGAWWVIMQRWFDRREATARAESGARMETPPAPETL